MKTLPLYVVVSCLTLLGIVSCSHDTRPLGVRVNEALTRRLNEYGVKGASVAIILPYGHSHCVCAGVSADTVAMRPIGLSR
jgi:hypothetical protein